MKKILTKILNIFIIIYLDKILINTKNFNYNYNIVI